MSAFLKNLEIKQLKQSETDTFMAMIEMFYTVFEEEPAIGSKAHLQRMLTDPRFIAIAAIHEHKVLGGLTAYVLPMYYSDSSEVLLYDMAVKPEHQRMGIGKALLQQLRQYCQMNGVGDFFVLAHAEDEHAIEFYRSTGGRSEQVVNFVYAVDEDQP